MRIGVLSEGDTLESFVAEDFGHAPYFLIVDPETLDYQVVSNEFVGAAGAGLKVADAIIALKVDEEIGGGVPAGRTLKAVQVGGPSGGCIPAALADAPVDYEALTAAGIKVSFDEEGTAEDSIRDFMRRLERQKRFSD
jgi:predicted Fe-Mo cluster-binding NifX family protein